MNKKPIALHVFGGFVPEPVAPTCSGGLGRVANQMMEMTMDERVRISKIIMDAIWSQPPPLASAAQPPPLIETVSDLVTALCNGWAYNANEAHNLFVWFGDIRAIKDAASGQFLGVGLMAPDGALIRDGRDLLDWRDYRWAGIRVAEYLSGASHCQTSC